MTASSTRPSVVLGTSRSQGETRRAVDLAFGGAADVIDLNAYKIGMYDYEHANAADDFLGLVERLLASPTLVFATPVYWYAMSAQLKTFIDRLSDLITVRKSMGRALAGKAVWLVCSGTDPEPPPGFETPFVLTSDYFAMTYWGSAYLYTGDEANLRAAAEGRLRDFGERVLQEHAASF